VISESGRPNSAAVIDVELCAGPCYSGVRDYTVLVMVIAATAAVSLAGMAVIPS
jgi:hypothetical protein